MSKVSKSEIAAAVESYDPSKDFGIWQELANFWRNVASEFLELAVGYRDPNLGTVALCGRLRTELALRDEQQLAIIKEAKIKFRKLAGEALEKSDAEILAEKILAQHREDQALVTADRRRINAQLAANVEARAVALDEQAAAVRAGTDVRHGSIIVSIN